MMKSLNRDQFLENLQYRMGWSGYTAAKLESQIGVYSGYISRMKSDPQKLPALDIAWKMAQALGVNLEWLIEGSVTPDSPDEAYLRRFLNRLFDLTNRREMRWICHPIAVISNTASLNSLHQLLPFAWEPAEKEIGMVRIHSLALPEAEAHFTGDLWSASIDERRSIWLLPLAGKLELDDSVVVSPEDDWIEMILQDSQHPSEPSLVCSSVMPGGDSLKPYLRKLLDEVKVQGSDLILDQNVKSVLDAFMEKTEA